MIDEQIQQFAREIAALAGKYGIRRINGSILPGVGYAAFQEVTFTWAAGRHGEDANQIDLATTQQVRVRVDASPQPQPAEPK